MPGRASGTGAAEVIDLARRRPTTPTPATAAAAAPALADTAAGPAADPAPAANLSLAITVEALYKARGQTLTDPDTACAYATAIEAVQLMLDGARARGLTDEATFTALSGMLTGMRESPQLL
ncbi:hypothetical protein [Streptomyces alfalfae]